MAAVESNPSMDALRLELIETLLKLGESRVTAGLMSPRDVIANYEGGINAFLDPSKRIKGISTGFTKLDEMTGGLHKGELIILAARPSMGKTAFALNIASHVAIKLGEPRPGILKTGIEQILRQSLKQVFHAHL